MNHLPLHLPDFSCRRPTSAQFLDGGHRITNVLLDLKSGLPLGDELCRELATGAGDSLVKLSERLDLDRKGKYTEEKAELDRERRLYYEAIRRGIRGILADPDPALPPSRRAGAEVLQELVAKRKKRMTAKAQGDTTTELRLFFADCDTPEIQLALKQTDLLRFYKLLQTAHNAHSEVVLKADRPKPAIEPTSEEKNAAQKADQALMRELKETIQNKLALAFEVMEHHASNGRSGYAELLASCATIADEINSLAKTRKTRARKAAEKKETSATSPTKPAHREASAPQNPTPAPQAVAPGVGLAG
jgi:hypothetical protein